MPTGDASQAGMPARDAADVLVAVADGQLGAPELAGAHAHLASATAAFLARDPAAAVRWLDTTNGDHLSERGVLVRLHLAAALTLGGHRANDGAFEAIAAASAEAVGPVEQRLAALAAAGFAGRRFALEKCASPADEPCVDVRVLARVWLTALG